MLNVRIKILNDLDKLAKRVVIKMDKNMNIGQHYHKVR